MRCHRGREAHRVGRVIVAALLMLVVASGCKGGSSEENSVTPCTNISFTPGLSSPAAGDVFLVGVASTCSTVDVSVIIYSLSGIWTVGFDIKYPSSVLSYSGTFFKGSVLASAPVFYVAPGASPGNVQVIITRFPPDPSVAVTGAGTLLTLRFNKVASGTGLIDFDMSGSSTVTEEILDENSNPRPASFGPGHGGTVTVP